MRIKPEEISSIIKEQIKAYSAKAEMHETGTVIQTGDGIATIYGLRQCMANELLEFEDGSYGIAQNLEDETVSAAILAKPAISRKARASAARAEFSLCLRAKHCSDE